MKLLKSVLGVLLFIFFCSNSIAQSDITLELSVDQDGLTKENLIDKLMITCQPSSACSSAGSDISKFETNLVSEAKLTWKGIKEEGLKIRVKRVRLKNSKQSQNREVLKRNQLGFFRWNKVKTTAAKWNNDYNEVVEDSYEMVIKVKTRSLNDVFIVDPILKMRRR